MSTFCYSDLLLAGSITRNGLIQAVRYIVVWVLVGPVGVVDCKVMGMRSYLLEAPVLSLGTISPRTKYDCVVVDQTDKHISCLYYITRYLESTGNYFSKSSVIVEQAPGISDVTCRLCYIPVMTIDIAIKDSGVKPFFGIRKYIDWSTISWLPQHVTGLAVVNKFSLVPHDEIRSYIWLAFPATGPSAGSIRIVLRHNAVRENDHLKRPKRGRTVSLV